MQIRPVIRSCLVALVCLTACGANKQPDAVFLGAPAAQSSPLDASSEPLAEVAYAPSARENFERAEALARAGKLDDARSLFIIVAKRFAYSQQASSAALRVADIDFAKKSFAAAADEYGAWAHDHPSDERMPLALRRAATAQCRAANVSACQDDYDGGL